MTRHRNPELHALPIPTRECLDFLRHQGVSQETLTMILVKLAPVEFLPNRRFEFSLYEDAEPSFVIEVPDACGDPIDLIAWPIRQPDRWAVLERRAWALGEPALINPATYFAGGVLRAVRTPLGWLQAGGEALCILDSTIAWWRLRACPRLAGEDLGHGDQIERLLQPPPPVTKIMVPHDAGRQAA